MITLKELKKDPEVEALVKYTDFQLEHLGYTEHSHRHISIVSNWAKDIAVYAGSDEHEVALVEIAGYLHDIGNAVNRHQHAQNGAILAYQLLTKRGMDFEDAAAIMSAIGNHDETEGSPVSRIAACLIIADKADVHRSRVRFSKRSLDKVQNDIHDRVNFAVESSHIEFENNEIQLKITIDTNICPVMDYFEIYFKRMNLCRQSAEVLDKKFSLIINNAKII